MVASLTGNLPFRGQFATAVSHDGTRAFVYAQDDAGTRLEVYDLNGALQTGAMYPLLFTQPIPDDANTGLAFQYVMAMTVSPDDSVVFIAGGLSSSSCR